MFLLLGAFAGFFFGVLLFAAAQALDLLADIRDKLYGVKPYVTIARNLNAAGFAGAGNNSSSNPSYQSYYSNKPEPEPEKETGNDAAVDVSNITNPLARQQAMEELK